MNRHRTTQNMMSTHTDAGCIQQTTGFTGTFACTSSALLNAIAEAHAPFSQTRQTLLLPTPATSPPRRTKVAACEVPAPRACTSLTSRHRASADRPFPPAALPSTKLKVESTLSSGILLAFAPTSGLAAPSPPTLLPEHRPEQAGARPPTTFPLRDALQLIS